METKQEINTIKVLEHHSIASITSTVGCKKWEYQLYLLVVIV